MGFIALVGFVLALAGVIIGLAALFRDDDGGAVLTSSDDTAVPVSLTEFAVAPDPIRTSGHLEVRNDGAAAHNLAVKEAPALTTPDLAGGETAALDVSSLEPGTYTVICTIPGHEAAGMSATLEVSEGTAATGRHNGGADTNWAALDQAMRDSMLRFPAATEGGGNQPLEPTIAPDGTKVFDLTAEIVPWEVEPGKVVEAWAYNGQVPGERYSALVHLSDPGTWVWHCHILTHVERDEGMFGMVTAVIVE